MSHNDHASERHTSILFSSFLRAQIPQAAKILIPCHQQALRMVIYWDRYPRAAMKWWRGEGSTEYGGKSDEGHPTRLLAELFKTLLVIDAAREFFLTYN